MFAILSKYDINEIIKYRNTPSITVEANTEAPWLDNGESNAKAKSLGFRYNGDVKKWQKQIKETVLKELRQKAQQIDLAVSVVK